MASFFMPNLGGGLITTALPPAFPASLILELLTGRVVSVPFDESTVVEGTVFLTAASSPDVVIRDILAVGLERQKSQVKESKSTNSTQSTRLQSTSYLPIAGSLRGASTLPCYRSSTLRVSCLGIYIRTGAVLPIAVIPSCLIICTTKIRD